MDKKELLRRGTLQAFLPECYKALVSELVWIDVALIKSLGGE